MTTDQAKTYWAHAEKECDTVRYNWFFSNETGEEFKEACTGVGGVIRIVEHAAAGEGDKWFYDVLFENDRVQRIFNPHEVFYSIIKSDK